MKRITLALLVALTALVLTNPARAKSQSLACDHENTENKDATLHSSSNATPLMCDVFSIAMYRGETSISAKSLFLAGITRTMPGTFLTLDSKAAGLIYKNMLARSLTTLQASRTVRELAYANEQKNSYGGAASDDSYLSIANTRSGSIYPGLVLYTRLNTQSASGFEPASLTLLGTGLVGLAGAIRRKLAKTA